MTRPRSPVRQQIAHYLRRNLILALACAGPIAMLFAVVGIVYKSNPADIWTGIGLAFALAAMFYFAGAFACIRFVRMIRLQEALFETDFDDQNATVLDRIGLTFVSERWFIRSGSAAFYDRYIRSIRYRTLHSQNGVGYRVTVLTTDGKSYGLWLNSVSDIKRVQAWLAERRRQLASEADKPAEAKG
jgi:hypothetical protein